MTSRATLFPARIPEFYKKLIYWDDPNDPLRKMVEPDPREHTPHPYELLDPIGDHAHEVIPGLIHRYPNRCLILLTSYCLVHCRFCFRQEAVGKVRAADIIGIQRYLKEHTEIEECIFSGGDPGTFPTGFFQHIVELLAPIRHIAIWRFHTRVPAVDPTAIAPGWIDTVRALRDTHEKQTVVVVHINHPREMTSEFCALTQRIQEAGALVVSQTVLLRDVNTDTTTLATLFQQLYRAGIKPYYLHHLDQVVGSHHFRISVEEGKKIYYALRGRLSGLALPEYVLDLPGGHGKVPILSLEKTGERTYQVTSFRGERICYEDHG